MLVALVPDFEASTGIKVELLADTAGALTKRVEAGESFDLLFLTPAGLTSLSKQGKVDPASIRSVARVAIGVAVRSARDPARRGAFRAKCLDTHRVRLAAPDTMT